jgi:hypothetical protein
MRRESRPIGDRAASKIHGSGYQDPTTIPGYERTEAQTAEDRAVQQARSFLIKKQEKSGRWGMGGGNQSFFTTGWAVVGLMSSLPSK